MKINEIRDLDTDMLRNKIEEQREVLFKLRLQWHANSLDDANEITKARKVLARMMTILRERELAAALLQEEGNA